MDRYLLPLVGILFATTVSADFTGTIKVQAISNGKPVSGAQVSVLADPKWGAGTLTGFDKGPYSKAVLPNVTVSGQGFHRTRIRSSSRPHSPTWIPIHLCHLVPKDHTTLELSSVTVEALDENGVVVELLDTGFSNLTLASLHDNELVIHNLVPGVSKLRIVVEGYQQIELDYTFKADVTEAQAELKNQ